MKNRDCIHFLNTGSSDAILIESQGRFALVDAAEDTDNPRGFEWLDYKGYEELVLEYLKKNAADKSGRIKLDFILGTHCHSDHIGGFDTVINDNDVEIGRAYLREYDESKIVDYEVKEWDNLEVYQQMTEALKRKNIPIISNPDSTPFTLGNFTITLFNTENIETEEKVGENDNSIGMLITKGKTRIFLAGDIDDITGDETRLAPQIGKVNLLKIGHHSYACSTTENWLKTLNPDMCIITNDESSIDFETIKRIEENTNSAILITGKENGIIAVADKNGNIEYQSNIH